MDPNPKQEVLSQGNARRIYYINITPSVISPFKEGLSFPLLLKMESKRQKLEETRICWPFFQIYGSQDNGSKQR